MSYMIRTITLGFVLLPYCAAGCGKATITAATTSISLPQPTEEQKKEGEKEAEEQKKRDADAEEYKKLVDALGSKMLKARL